MSMTINEKSAIKNFLDSKEFEAVEQQEIKEREEAIDKNDKKVGEAVKSFNDFLVGAGIGITGGILFVTFCNGMLKLAKKNHLIYGK